MLLKSEGCDGSYETFRLWLRQEMRQTEPGYLDTAEAMSWAIESHYCSLLPGLNARKACSARGRVGCLLDKIPCKILIEVSHQCSLPKNTCIQTKIKYWHFPNCVLNSFEHLSIHTQILLFSNGLTKVVVNESGMAHIALSTPRFLPESPPM